MIYNTFKNLKWYRPLILKLLLLIRPNPIVYFFLLTRSFWHFLEINYQDLIRLVDNFFILKLSVLELINNPHFHLDQWNCLQYFRFLFLLSDDYYQLSIHCEYLGHHRLYQQGILLLERIDNHHFHLDQLNFPQYSQFLFLLADDYYRLFIRVDYLG